MVGSQEKSERTRGKRVKTGEKRRCAEQTATAPSRNNDLVMALCICVIALFGASVIFADSYDYDIWFILATGEHIVNAGMPYTNPFTIHEGLDMVVQQWIPCVIAYAIYQQAGFVGLGCLVLALYVLVIVSLYRLGRQLRRDRFGGEYILLAMIPGLWSLASYMSVRPHLYTMLAYIWIIYFLEKYRSSHDVRFLIPLPFICAVHINFQSALAPFDLVIMLCYAIPDFMAKLHERGRLLNIELADATYRRLPILIVMVVSFAAFFLNPYTSDGALYLLYSFGAASHGNLINEMLPFDPTASPTSVFTVITLLVTLFCVIKFSPKTYNLPLTLLIVGTFAMTIMQSRNKWLPTLFCIMLLAWISRGRRIEKLANIPHVRAIATAIAAVGVVASAIICVVVSPDLASLPHNNQKTPVAAMDYLDEKHADKETLRVFTFFNAGAYVEYRGYHVNMDARPELWSTKITHADKDYYEEYVDMVKGRLYMDVYVDSYDFDVLIIPNDDNSLEYFSSNWDYVQIPSGDDYSAFAKRGLFSEEAS